jgi:hypothetical protein
MSSSFVELLEGEAQFFTIVARELLSPTLPVFITTYHIESKGFTYVSL